MMSRCFVFLLLLNLLSSCREQKKLFQKLSADETGIDFTNTITEDKAHNVFTYQYYYNGNGVAVGDVNGDGLTDLFFTGNQTPSKLYLNKGNFQFKDVTDPAGVGGKKAWRTGANMADVNGDGLLDIYVCYSGAGTDQDRANQLFINQGVNKDGIPVFAEKAAAYGLDAEGTYTSQSAFFDYDRDGDLDMFLLNHADGFYSPFFNTRRLRTLRHPRFGNRLYRNDDGHFTDVSTPAGILGGGINFGLGIAVSDLNSDGWPDILVSNDFHEQDFCYINNRDGTFKEVCQQVMGHMSRNTMGMDIADYNNDLLPDIVTLDMLPETNYRQKILQGPDEYDKYRLMVDSGYGNQYNRNMLQLHRGFTAEGLPVFSEIGQLAGISNTDWSWAALLADFDNDGQKDLFVTNGYLRESTNLDFIKYNVQEALAEARRRGLDISTRESYERNMPLYELVRKMPSTKLANYMFHNRGNLTFSNESRNWGLDEPGVSSGASYADLDNDGDLDLIVCNNDDPVWLYKNNESETIHHNFIKVKLKGGQKNPFGIGARVVVITDSSSQLQEMYPVRGYQSSVDYILNFGIGKQKGIRQIKVFWANDSATIVNHPPVNTTVVVSQRESVRLDAVSASQPLLFEDVSKESGISFVQSENEYVDFKREFLIPYELSRQGPRMAKGDVNGDGLEDIYIGGAAEQSGSLYLQTGEGKFKRGDPQPWLADAIYEDVGSAFFDADGDGDLDLYVVSGGSEWSGAVPGLQDRLYLNDGKGHFTRAAAALPPETYSGSCVQAADFDGDGDLDLFVGARTIPGNYPFSEGSMLLRNDGDKARHGVRFTDVTKSMAGMGLFRAGMVTDVAWADVDRDGWPDLVVAGDWMPVKIFHNEKGKSFTDVSHKTGLDSTNGWWCKIIPADIDKDGDIDFILGNLGTNTQFKVNNQQPLVTYAGDFNGDGKVDPVMTWYVQGVSYPFNSRDELVEKMPQLNKKFLKYADYANATIHDVLSEEQIEKAAKFYIYTTQTSLLINNKGKFALRALPLEAQFSANQAILYKDFDGDGREDILLAGNFYPFRVQQGQCDAGIGCLLKGNGKGAFSPLIRSRSGLFVPGDVRDAVEVNGKEGSVIVVSKNSDAVQVIKRNR
ncbi:MAG: VCBS repeat-containing protein [Williamsia sp.]|nr:VCBS repeat-containing protein [Williamsia sp.]